MGLSITGNQLRMWYKPAAGVWAQLGATWSDAQFAGVARKLGMGAYGSTLRLDNFGGGTR